MLLAVPHHRQLWKVAAAVSPHVASASVQGQTLPRAAQAVQINLRSKEQGGLVGLWFGFFFFIKAN